MSRHDDDREGIGALDYGTAGFGAGQVLGGDAARRQQEILTGSEYSANMPPPGYRPGFQPEYLYFGDPRYEDYMALLPGVYGTGYESLLAPPTASPTAPPVAPPVAPPTSTGLNLDPVTGLPMYTGDAVNFTEADAKKAMDLIVSGQYDINSLASQLGVPQDVAFNLYNQYLTDTYGVGAFDPNAQYGDQALQDLAQQYYSIANQYGYSPEQLSRIFGTPLDQTRSYLSQQYLGGIPVDQDYSAVEAQGVYDLYRSGRIGIPGIANYFGIPEGEVQSILDSIETAGGSAEGIFRNEPVTTMPIGSTTVRPQDVRSTDRGTGAVDPTVEEETEGADINPISTALDLYKSGVELPPEQIRETLEYAQSNNISFAQLDRMFGAPAGSAQNAAAALGMAARTGGIAGMAEGRRVMFDEMGKVITDESDMTQMFNELYAKDPTGPKDPTGEEIDEEIRMLESRIRRANIAKAKQFDELSSDPLNRIAGLVTSMTESAPSELIDRLDALKRARDRVNKAKGIKGMAEGGEFPDLSGDGEVTKKDILIGRGVIEKAEGGILSGIAGLFNKEEEPKPQGGALLTETESYLEAQRILSDPDSSDRDRAFAKGTLETLKPEQQGGNMDMNAYSLMMQQVDKILGATRNMQEGGYINRDELDSLIEMTRDAILGDAENADEIIQRFIAVFGNEAFQQLRETVLQSQVPNAQTEGMLEGQGGGMDDEINGMIGNQQPVAVSPGEYIIPADVVSSLGDGSSDAGADKLDKLLDDVRMEKTGTTVQPGKISESVMPL